MWTVVTCITILFKHIWYLIRQTGQTKGYSFIRMISNSIQLAKHSLHYFILDLHVTSGAPFIQLSQVPPHNITLFISTENTEMQVKKKRHNYALVIHWKVVVWLCCSKCENSLGLCLGEITSGALWLVWGPQREC